MSNLITVSAAILFHEGKFLITQRKDQDHLGGYWEFPGGKCHQGETLEHCLKREVQEELHIEVAVRKKGVMG